MPKPEVLCTLDQIQGRIYRVHIHNKALNRLIGFIHRRAYTAHILKEFRVRGSVGLLLCLRIVGFPIPRCWAQQPRTRLLFECMTQQDALHNPFFKVFLGFLKPKNSPKPWTPKNFIHTPQHIRLELFAWSCNYKPYMALYYKPWSIQTL